MDWRILWSFLSIVGFGFMFDLLGSLSPAFPVSTATISKSSSPQTFFSKSSSSADLESVGLRELCDDDGQDNGV